MEDSVVINASPIRVSRVLALIRRWPEIFAGVQKVEHDRLFPEFWGRIQVTYLVAGHTSNFSLMRIEYEPQKKYIARLEGMATGIFTVDLAPAGKATHLRMIIKYELVGADMEGPIDTILVERMNEQQLHQSLNNLRVLLEGWGSLAIR